MFKHADSQNRIGQFDSCMCHSKYAIGEEWQISKEHKYTRFLLYNTSLWGLSIFATLWARRAIPLQWSFCSQILCNNFFNISVSTFSVSLRVVMYYHLINSTSLEKLRALSLVSATLEIENAKHHWWGRQRETTSWSPFFYRILKALSLVSAALEIEYATELPNFKTTLMLR